MKIQVRSYFDFFEVLFLRSKVDDEDGVEKWFDEEGECYGQVQYVPIGYRLIFRHEDEE